ncbi:MAG: c-type cytochrome [Deltaproteobacteria bacterium]|nr:c-type cytochrome [Deltaproteobacteria bacterium]
MIALVAGVGCGGKKDDKPPGKPGSGSDGSATPVETSRPRPSQEPLPPVPQLQLPEDPKRKEKIALGNTLFFDKRLSGNNDRACYSCHKNEDGNGGHDPIAIGSGDKKLTRHSPSLWNVGYYKKALYWDGRAPTLEANVKGAWGGGNMGAGDAKDDKKNVEMLDKKAAELAALPEYKALFDAAFPGAAAKAEQVQAALAEYMRTMVCNNTAYDRWVNKDTTALDDKQQRGLDLFLGKGGCTSCHVPPFFTSAMEPADGAYFNIGIGTQDVPEDKVDVGRMKVSNRPEDWGAFKPPSLRNVSRTAPYFHDGSVDTLEKAVRLMAAGGYPNKNKSPLAIARNLVPAEIDDIVAFLKALDCNTKLTLPDGSDPDAAGGGGGGDGGAGSGSAAGSSAGSGSAKP